jgi:hypothetical protein
MPQVYVANLNGFFRGAHNHVPCHAAQMEPFAAQMQKILRSGLEVELQHGDIVSLGGPTEHGETLHPICSYHYIHELFCTHGDTN